ncbi:MAG: hypothetical protein EXR75_13640, partial [Myxococcales bacterium]|nr:hypothetical protein [Myxococcales bacterium]
MSDLRSMGAWHVRASSTLGWLLAALLLLATSTAVAQPSKKSPEDRGKELAVEGLTLYQANKFKEALVKFEEAETHYPTAQVLRMKGYALVGMQRWVEAAESIEGALKNELKPLMPADAEDAEDQLKDVLSHVATVTIKAAVPIATVRVDGGGARELPQTLRLNVGSHRFVVEAKNRETLDSLHDVVAGPSTLTLTPGISKAKPIDKVTRKIDDDEEAESKRGDDEERRRPKKDPDDKEAEDDAAAEEAKKRAAEKEAEDAETEERTPSKKPSAPSAGLFPHQVPVGLALMGVGVAAAAVGAGTGG